MAPRCSQEISRYVEVRGSTLPSPRSGSGADPPCPDRAPRAVRGGGRSHRRRVGRHGSVRGGRSGRRAGRHGAGRGARVAAVDVRDGARQPAAVRGDRGAVRGLERRDAGVPPRPVVRGPVDRARQPVPHPHAALRDLPGVRADRRRGLHEPRPGHRRAQLRAADRGRRAPLHPGIAARAGGGGAAWGLLGRPDARPARPGPCRGGGAAQCRPGRDRGHASRVPRRPRPRADRRSRLDRGPACRRLLGHPAAGRPRTLSRRRR